MAVFTLLLGLTGGCDLPTEGPEWDQRWVVPAEEITVGVENLLPDQVTILPDGSAFSVDVAPVVFQQSLGPLCALCQALDGRVVPKPAFQGTFQETAELPPDLSQASVQEGRIRVEIQNGFSFDPIRPGGAETGTLTLSLFTGGSGGTLLDQAVVDGAAESFPPGVTLTRSLQFNGPVENPLLVVVSADSPLGSPVPIHFSESLSVEASVPLLEVVSANIRVAGRHLVLNETDLDVEDVDEGVVDRIISGALEMDIRNPWGVGAAFTLRIQAPSQIISKAFNIPEGPESSSRVEFTQSELKAFLGQPGIVLGGTGVVDPGAGYVTLTPGQFLTLDTKLDLVVRIGGGEE